MTGDAHRLGGLCIGVVTAYYSTKIPAIAEAISMEAFLLAPVCTAMGYLFHLIQDSFTKGGIPWMYPIKRYRFHLLPMRSGSLFQWPIVFALVLAYSEILNYFLIPD